MTPRNITIYLQHNYTKKQEKKQGKPCKIKKKLYLVVIASGKLGAKQMITFAML